ncbi:hypothetical protein BT96DRAFT_505851 [Gymnopus androsaceus JB14]|uniref:Uncharacterized protein n=1 Tax=Gymnopus androsaceus JB14 TaxID=1447944 RepID=A0A6A4I303_9AGAR|nr:hypothetical protein BT96DRAFT_505851 [Gymnopus androsaceus JB14]
MSDFQSVGCLMFTFTVCLLVVHSKGAPGSQNGFDNSGHRISFPQWQASQTNIQHSDAIIKTLANMFKDNMNVVPIIALLNEPAGFDGQDVLDAVRQYWYDSYGNTRSSLDESSI